ncbi:glycyl radical protein [Diplocloster modestus]|uniref:Glycyl radical protein n=1 Tax=Diplocloster modestus TaxID=2850322 RepID=A0ABS6KB19_9FIRM|nr:glycyl radical protein [Diplocloster modestus]MBU9727703.1 glycyl radical protein [Diplocloster modestus]
MESNFGTSTQRIKNFREKLLAITPAVCTERAVLTTKAYQEHEMDQVVLKRAYMVKEILENMSIFIEPETLIVGNQAKENRSAPIFPEYAMDWVIEELDEFDKRNGDRFLISEVNKKILRDIYPYWKGRTLQDKGYAAFPDEAKVIYDLGIIRNEGNITSGDAHLAVDYQTVLQKGLGYYRLRTREKLDALDYAEFENMKASYFYRAILIVIDAVEAFARRYARLAAEQAKTAGNQRKQELEQIARICERVPMEPAQTFQEALQSVWFIHLILQIESNGHSLSFGRFDQYCFPYYEKSIRDGMKPEEAEELLENLWLKSFTINKIRSWGHTRFAAGSPMYQNITIGGQTVDGKDAVNPLTWAVLRSVARTHLPQPNMTVRYFSNMSQEFMNACIECIRLGFGMPAFNNDEIVIEALMDKGVSKEDAYNYSAIGCVEVGVPGRWGYRCTGMSYLNFPKTLMTALNDGVDVNTGKKICKGLGHFLNMESFEDVMKAWDYTARQLIHTGVILDNCADMVVEQEVPDILCSALVDDCIERGKHLKEGGAHYDIVSQLQVGVANLGDSLAALKKCVYEEEQVSRKDLWDALMNDFADEEGKRIRRILMLAPKYGNDNDYVDDLVKRGYDTYLDEIKKYKNTRYGRGPIGGTYYAGTSSVAANVPQGAGTCATPDGRHFGEPLAEGCSPSHAVDLSGPTSVFKSVSKLKTSQIFGGVLLNQKVTPAILERAEDRQKLGLLIRTFFDVLKGWHVQYNVVSRETLLDAQKHPDQYPDLIVRVAGYSAFFHVLSPQTQDDIIARTEQRF